MDKTTFRSLSYGLYIIGAKDGERNTGCVVNTVTQSTSGPVTLTVCINKDNYTNHCIKKSREFAVSILSERAKENTIAVFGFSSSRDKDKFADVPFGLTPGGLPYIKEGVTGYIQCRVIDFVDVHTHTVFIAEAVEAENVSKEPPMTYAYYHNVIKGKTPKKASSFASDETEAAPASGSYKCGVCGYIYPGSREEFLKLPDDFVCPVCRVGKDKFIPL